MKFKNADMKEHGVRLETSFAYACDIYIFSSASVFVDEDFSSAAFPSLPIYRNNQYLHAPSRLA